MKAQTPLLVNTCPIILKRYLIQKLHFVAFLNIWAVTLYIFNILKKFIEDWFKKTSISHNLDILLYIIHILFN